MNIPFELNRVHCIDCLEALKLLPDGCVDLVLTDPPYGTTDLEFDKSATWDWVQPLLRVVKPNGYLAVFLPVTEQARIAKHWPLRFSGAWVKPRPTLRTATAKKPMNQWELYCVYAHPAHTIHGLTFNKPMYQGEPYSKVMRTTPQSRGGKDQVERANASTWTQNGYVCESDGDRYYSDTLFFPNKPCMEHSERTEHPTQKPEGLMRVLCEMLSNEGDLVFDPFAGSGTTGVAAVQLGRRFLGFEIDPQYRQLANDRIEAARKGLTLHEYRNGQLTLFEDEQ